MLIPYSATADTTVSSNITTNTTWNVAGSPYQVTTDIDVNVGVTLTIQPGVTVEMGSGCEIDVRGTLIADGTPANPITFTSSSGSPWSGIWDRIYFGSGSNASGCIVDNCDFEYADEGIYCYYADLDVTNSTFDTCDNGLYLYDSENKLTNVSVTKSDEEGIESRYGTLNMYDCYLNDNDYDGIYMYYGDGFSIDNSTITNHTGYDGIELDDTDYGYVNNTFFQNNQYGIYDDWLRDYLLVKDCIFYGHSTSIYTNIVDETYLINNTHHDDSSSALNIGTDLNSKIINCTILSPYRGIEVVGSDYLTVEDTNIVDFSYQGFYVRSFAEPVFINCTASGSTGNATLRVESASTHPVFIDCDLSSTATSDVAMLGGSDATLVNCTFSVARTYVSQAETTVYKKEYFDIKVTNQTHTACPNALYTVTDDKNTIVSSGWADGTGYARDVVFTELEILLGPDYDPNPYTVKAMQDTGWWTESGEKTVTIAEDDEVEVKMDTDSSLIIWATDHVLTSNEEYENVTIIAMGNVTVPGPWYLGFLNNVTLLMNHDTSLEKGIGLSNNGALNWTNSSVRSIGSDSGGKKTRYYFNCQNSIVQWDKVNITHFDSAGLEMDFSWVNISNSDIHGPGADGIDAAYSNMNIHNTKFYDFTLYSLDLMYCDDMNITWCKFWDVEYAIDLYYCDRVLVHNTTVTRGYRGFANYYSEGPSEYIDCEATYVDYSFYIYDADDVNLTRCTAQYEDAGTSYGFYVRYYCTNIIMRECLVTNMDYGIHSDEYSDLFVHDTLSRLCNRGTYVDYSYFYGYNLTVSGCTYAFDTESYLDRVYLFNCSLSGSAEAFVADDGTYVIENCTLTSTGGTRVFYGYESHTTMYNTTINNLGATYEFYLDGYFSDRQEIYMVNCSWTDTSIYFYDSYNTVYKQAFFRIFIQNSSGGVDGAEYSVVDDMDALLYSGITDAAGFSPVEIFTQKTITSGGTTTPGQYTITAYNYIGNQVELGDLTTTVTAGSVQTVNIALDTSYIIWAGDHVLTSNESYRDVKIIAMGNVVVPAPWWLAFETNVTLYMKHNIDYRKGIEILDGGFFNCTGSNITSIGISQVRPATYYRFWVGKTTGARLNLSYSNITRLGSLGIRINNSNADDILIWESEFFENQDCLTLDGGGATIWNTTFTRTEDEAIWGDAGDHIEMWGCDFCYFDDAVVLDFTDWVNITDCYFYDGYRDGTGIEGYYADNVNVTDCYFHYSDYGVYNTYGQVYSQDNWYENLDAGGLYSGTSGWTRSYNDWYYRCDVGAYSSGWTTADMFVLEATFHSCMYGGYVTGVNTFMENITATNCDYVLRVADNDYLVVRNLTATLTDDYGVYGDRGIAWFYDCDFDDPDWQDTVYSYWYSNLNFTNCTLGSPVSASDYAVYATSSSTVRLTNCSVNTAELHSTASNCPIYVLHHVHIKCRLNSGNPYPGANVTVKDNYGKLQVTTMSSTGGWTRGVPVLHFQELNGVSYNGYNNINFTAQDYGYLWTTFSSVTSFKVVYITISDNVDPVTTLTIGTPKYRAMGIHYWNVSGATTFTLSATDFFTGVDEIYYQIDSGSWSTYSTPFTLNAYSEGLRRVRYYADDMDGNTESTHTIYVRLDKSAPAPSISIGDPKYRSGASDVYNITSSTQISLNAADPAGWSAMFYRIDGAGWITYGSAFTLSTFAEGIHTIEANAMDNLGINGTSYTLTKVYLDDTGPSVSMDIVGPNHRAGLSDILNITNATTIGLIATDNFAGVEDIYYSFDDGGYQLYTIPIDFSTQPEGYHSLDFYATDNLGTDGITYQVGIYIDLSAPVTTLVATGPSYKALAPDIMNISSATLLELVTSDNHAGTEWTRYSIDGGPFNDYTGGFYLTGTPGVRRISFYSADYLDNLESEKTIWVNLDLSAPTSSMTVKEPKFRGWGVDDWNITSLTKIELSATDGSAGIENLFYSVDGANWTTYSGPFSLTGLSQGKHYLRYYAVDRVNNSESYHLVGFNIDDHGPDVTLTPQGPHFYGNGTLAIGRETNLVLTAEDPYSGVEMIYYKIDTGTYGPYTSPLNLAYLTEGEHTLEFYAVDNLGLLGPANITTIILVKYKPTVDMTLGDPSYSDDDDYVTKETPIWVLTISATDMDTVTYKVDASPVWYVEGPINLSKFEDGEHTITVTATDVLGQATEASITVTLDSTAPTVTYSVDVDKVGEVYLEQPTVMLSSTDAGAGVDKVYYRTNIGDVFKEYGSPVKIEGLGTTTIQYYAVDNLGNEGEIVSLDIMVVSDNFLEVDALEDIYNVDTIKVTGIATPLMLVELYVDGVYLERKTVNDGTFEFSISLPEGDSTLFIRLVDTDLNMLDESTAQTVTIDTIAPTITKSVPANDATKVGTGIEIVITLSEKVVESTASVVVSTASGSVSGTTVYDDNAKTLTFTPDSALEQNTVHHIRITAHDRAGNMLEADQSFTTSDKESGSGTGGSGGGGGGGGGGGTANPAANPLFCIVGIVLVLFIIIILLVVIIVVVARRKKGGDEEEPKQAKEEEKKEGPKTEVVEAEIESTDKGFDGLKKSLGPEDKNGAKEYDISADEVELLPPETDEMPDEPDIPDGLEDPMDAPYGYANKAGLSCEELPYSGGSTEPVKKNIKHVEMKPLREMLPESTVSATEDWPDEEDNPPDVVFTPLDD